MPVMISSTMPRRDVSAISEEPVYARVLPNVILSLAITALGILAVTGVLPSYSVPLGGFLIGLGALTLLFPLFLHQKLAKGKAALNFEKDHLEKPEEAEVPVQIDLKLVKESRLYHLRHSQTFMLYSITLVVIGVLGMTGHIPMKMGLSGVFLGVGGFSVGLGVNMLLRAYRAEKKVDSHIEKAVAGTKVFPHYKL